LLELLVGMAVLSIIMITISAAMGTMQNTWVRMREKSDTYRATRMALDNMSRRIAQATLATRWVQDEEADPTGTDPPFKPESDLHFVCGPVTGTNGLNPTARACGHAVFFQAPFGETTPRDDTDTTAVNQSFNHLSNTLCAWGYFVEFSEDNTDVPIFLRNDPDHNRPRRRFRLMEFRQPASELSLYQLDPDGKPKLASSSGPPGLYDWFKLPLSSPEPPVAVVAENVIAVIISPFDPQQGTSEDAQFGITKEGLYDTRRALWDPPPSKVNDPEYTQKSLHHLPPALRLTVIATSEDSWERLTQRLGEGLAQSTASQLMNLVNGRFTSGAPRDHKRDLDNVEDVLNKNQIDHRIFTIDIRLSEQ